MKPTRKKYFLIRPVAFWAEFSDAVGASECLQCCLQFDGETQRVAEDGHFFFGSNLRGVLITEFPVDRKGTAEKRAAPSISQIAVSTASTWQKNGRILLNLNCRQCWRSVAVSGVTSQSLGFGNFRHWST